ncbi:uncharacterized protein LOC128733932 [Sabethes cyaneus]|uniref:uncharacterized protein LOC128733932 n=1 Tax=Sabethes cyaneus TaxID=53552 RepID=UPI00237E3003|nr:uncharacterized protein LOC128733932 [Sabethes cyaneus]
MDLSEHELAELEERLYSSVHHVSTEPCILDSASKPCADLIDPNSSRSQKRVVTDKVVINDARQSNSKLKRYWSSLQQHHVKPYPGIQGNKVWIDGNAKMDTSSTSTFEKKQTFKPYQSILGGLTKNDVEGTEFLPMRSHTEERPKKKKILESNVKSTTNVNPERSRKIEQFRKMKAKKTKAQRCRQKTCTERLVATIEIESSSEEDGEYHSPEPIKQEIECQDLEDSDPDEVVVIPSAPPPLVCIESSDDEVDKGKFTRPNSKKKKNSGVKKTISPRCLSPSNSSMMSDDFLGQNDRARLNDSFIEGITNDDELDTGDHGDLTDISRVGRAPSISSEGTVATSSDTTDPDKRNGIKAVAGRPPDIRQPVVMPKSSTPKQLLPLKKQIMPKDNEKLVDADSIYTATSTRKPTSATEKLASSDSSDNSTGGNISSHSRRSKSVHSDSSCKSSKRSHKKRRKQESEHYSDEDFALMLTDIVHAMSENEKDKDISSEESYVGQLESSTLDTASTDQTVENPTGKDPRNSLGETSVPKDQEVDIDSPVVEPKATEISNSSVSLEQVCSPSDIPTETPTVINLTESNEIDDFDCGERVGFCADDPEHCWNDEMKRFYHNSWDCEDFNISTVLFNMPRSSKSWPIVHLDKYPDPPRKEIICNNCGERGHMRYKCRNRPKPGICFMCGQTGHQEPRCPNTLCLKCGEKTRNFMRGCQACSREQNMSCHLCGIRGHAHRNCPDKWRRYHSTIEDNVPLTQTLNRNPNAKHCCICSRPGHQAHMCNSALRIFGQLVPTTEVKSYQPMYNINEFRQQRNPNSGQKFNMFGDLTDYQLNFDSSFAMNDKSFYNRFVKSVGLFEKKKQREEIMSRKIQRERRKRKQAAKNVVAEQDPLKEIDATIEEAVMETNTNSASKDVTEKLAREDSNYSFSEFFEDASSTQTPQRMKSPADFIPLTSSIVTPLEPLTAEIEPRKTNAKIFLTKQHAKVLLGPNGTAFLKDASEKFALQLSVLFQSVGNVLLVNGLSKDQDNFHNELVKFLNDGSHQNDQLMHINNVPKLTEKTILYIVEHLRLLTRPYENVKSMFRRYQHFEEQGGSAKTADKIRRNLNIILFGQFGLRKGRDHLNKLQVNLKALRNSQEINVSMDIRNEINQHIRYIFTAYDHADYADILNEFEDLRKSQKLNKIKTEDLDLLPLPSSKNVLSADKDIADESYNSTKGLNYEDNSFVEQSHNEDLILNISNQLIALPNLETSTNEFKQSAAAIESAALATIRQQHATPKSSKLSFKKQKVESLLSECRWMVQQLDCPPMKLKFDRICCQTQEGEMSRANFRTLLKIRSILKNKLPYRNKNADD